MYVTIDIHPKQAHILQSKLGVTTLRNSKGSGKTTFVVDEKTKTGRQQLEVLNRYRD